MLQLKIFLSPIETIIDRAGVWFLRSGIQEAEGGVARYYRSDLQKNARVSTEITGYTVSFLVDLHARTGRKQVLDSALAGARFLESKMWNAAWSVFPFEYSSNGDQPEPLAFFFDSGIIARGLLAAWKASGAREFRDTALACGRGMLERFGGASASHPRLRLPELCAVPYESRWSAEPGCYQLKSAMAWRDLFEESGDPAFRTAYEEALAAALENSAGFLPGERDPERVMDRLHAFLYFLEGLLPAADRPECARALAAGVERVAQYVREIEPIFARSDVYAQLLRARLFAAQTGALPLDAEAAAREAGIAAAFQLESDDPRIDGGFAFGRKRGTMLPYVNPVSTAFCAQALAEWSAFQAGRPALDRRALV
jgi:hypothetical protein